MIKTVFICIILLLLCSPCFAETLAEILFEDDFSVTPKISGTNNIIFTNNSAQVVNPTNGKQGYIISELITKQITDAWQNIAVTYETSQPWEPTEIYIRIVDENNNLIITLNTLNDNNKLDWSTNKKSISFGPPNEITTYDSIKLKADFVCSSGPSAPYYTPILYSWEVTGAEIPDPDSVRYTNIFIGAPSPLEINDEDSRIKFYYMFKKDCEATFKILDPNYNLVKTLFENETYSSGESLNTTWNGKNGNDIYVMSGVYIAILEVKNNDGTDSSPKPFVFGVVR